jgi:prevent-host-death family protein
MNSKPRVTEEVVTVVEARNNFADICNRVAYAASHVVITKNGKPTVAVIPINEYEEFQRVIVRQALAEYDDKGAMSPEELDERLKRRLAHK